MDHQLGKAQCDKPRALQRPETALFIILTFLSTSHRKTDATPSAAISSASLAMSSRGYCLVLQGACQFGDVAPESLGKFLAEVEIGLAVLDGAGVLGGGRAGEGGVG